MADTNIIPTYYAAGPYVALNPFDAVVIPGKYYRAEALRSVAEMHSANFNFKLNMFDPAGIPEEDIDGILAIVEQREGAILTLIGNDGIKVYVPTTYLKSFPRLDGVVYERLCLVVDLGPCNPALKDIIKTTTDHISDYVEAHIGIKATVQIGVVPTTGYVDKDQAEFDEATRQNKIKDVKSDVVLVAEQEQIIANQAAYIVELQNALKAVGR